MGGHRSPDGSIPWIPRAAGVAIRHARGEKRRGENHQEQNQIASNREKGHSRDHPAVPLPFFPRPPWLDKLLAWTAMLDFCNLTNILCSPSQTSNPRNATIIIEWGSEEMCRSTKTALEAAPNPFSALFEELNPYY